MQRQATVALLFIIASIQLGFAKANSGLPQCIPETNGLCWGGAIGLEVASDKNQCEQICADNPDCHFYTFDGNMNKCFLSSNCVDIADYFNCNVCITGQVKCEPLPPCIPDTVGLCLGGGTLTSGTAFDEPSCIQQCLANPDCNFWTFSPLMAMCILSTECVDIIDLYCPTCTTGQVNCRRAKANPDVLLVQGGRNVDLGGALTSGEVLILDSAYEHCPPIPDLPFLGLTENYGATFMDGERPVICPGPDRVLTDANVNQCFVLSKTGDVLEWTPFVKMAETFYVPGYAQMENGDWWMVGSSDIFGDGGISSPKTQLYNAATKQFELGPDLPYSNYKQCIAVLNETHFISTGGISYTGATLANVSMYDTMTGLFTELPPMNLARHKHACGITHVKGSATSLQLIVAGPSGRGLNDAEILDLDTMQWRTGPLPGHREMFATSVPLGDSFMLVGGASGRNGPYRTQIIQYDIENENWITRPEVMQTARMAPHAIAVNGAEALGCY